MILPQTDGHETVAPLQSKSLLLAESFVAFIAPSSFIFILVFTFLLHELFW